MPRCETVLGCDLVGVAGSFVILVLTPAEELAEILSVVVHYEKKYGGEYKDTLAQKGELTHDEERDAHEWVHLLRAVEQHGV